MASCLGCSVFEGRGRGGGWGHEKLSMSSFSTLSAVIDTTAKIAPLQLTVSGRSEHGSPRGF